MTLAVDYLRRDRGPLLGLAVAIEDFMKAWLRYSRQTPLVCRADRPSAEHFLTLAREAGIDLAQRVICLDPHNHEHALAPISCLFQPDPDLSDIVWRRGQLPAPGYAACGLVHSMSGDQVTRAVADLCFAPTYGADALICPSRAIRDSVQKVWEVQSEYIAHRFGTPFRSPVQTPILPIGIDTDKFAAKSSETLRKAQREALGLAEDEIAVLFVGRLSFATKAHPLALLQAMAKAAKQTSKKLRLLFYGYFLPQAEMEPRFRDLIRDFAEGFRCDLITNDDPRFPEGLWAAADIFTSLVDNVQESYGLTPLEAMACGLPVVISDWDGYRDAVTPGENGYLIPTCAPPQAAGVELAKRFMTDRNYGLYLIGAAQSTSLDLDAAARAFVQLADNPEKRRAMGAAGRARVVAQYDWRVVIPAYEDLWQSLAEQRLAYAQTPLIPTQGDSISPYFPNPWRVFEAFASQTLSAQDRLRVVMTGPEISRILKHDMNLFMPDLLMPLPLLEGLIAALEQHGSLAIQDVLSVSPELEHPRLWRTMGWLLKTGICTREK